MKYKGWVPGSAFGRPGMTDVKINHKISQNSPREWVEFANGLYTDYIVISAR